MATPPLSRRSFLKLGGGAAAASLTGTVAHALPIASSSTGSTATVDVCVVGAGFAGLAAAHAVRAGGGSVVVLEARDRVGGRTLSIRLPDGGWVDEGGQWVGAGHDRLHHWIEATGHRTYPTPNVGEALVRGPGRTTWTRVGDDWSAVPGMDRADAVKRRLQAMADTIDPEAPWAHAEAAAWDGTTLAAWLAREVPDDELRRYLIGDMSYACASPEQISMLSFLAMVKQCVSFEKLNGFDDAAQQDRVIGGTQPVAQAMARMLGVSRVRLRAPVRRIRWSPAGCTVTADGVTVQARHVILACPPTLIGAIECSPSLPCARAQVTQHWPQGLVIKVGLVYERPFWREDGLSGLSLDYTALVSETADSSALPEYSRAGVLTGFLYTDDALAAARMAGPERRRRILEEMAARFGPKALAPLKVIEMNWSTQVWTRGCYGGYLAPGALVHYREAVRAPVGPLHFAGTETSPVWPGFIEGAIRSGERAAREVMLD
jgi:monoamine oxidase